MEGKQIIDPGWGWDETSGYSQAVRAGSLLFLAGQIPVDRDGNVVAANDIRGQTRQILENFRAVLAAAGATLDGIVDMVSYHTDMTEIAGMMEVKNEYLPRDFPAWTAVEVTSLALPGRLLEIKVGALARDERELGNA